jgi:GNAT superfamily N-acetyltransferase
MKASDASWQVHPVQGERWADLVRLFGQRGAHSNCWCLWWRLPHPEFSKLTPLQRRRRLRRLTTGDRPPGLLGYQDGEPVAWVSLGPRQDFAALQASRLFAPVDETPTWSVVCFFVRRDQRRQGWMRRLLRAAAEYAAARGAEWLEAYPLERGARTLHGDAGYTGVASTFRREGFRVVARRRDDRPVMRRRLRRGARRRDT